jgi:hypothetical protein
MSAATTAFSRIIATQRRQQTSDHVIDLEFDLHRPPLRTTVRAGKLAISPPPLAPPELAGHNRRHAETPKTLTV